MKRIWILGLVWVAACSSLPPPSPPPATLEPSAVVSEATPAVIPPTAAQCAYVEASQPLPDVSAKVDQAVKSIEPEASGWAQAFGENCIFPDGHGSFSAMETDFYLQIPVADLTDNNELGDWIAKGMNVLASFAPGVVPGPESGFVEFTFTSGDNQAIRRVPIARYKQLSAGKSGAELIQALFPNP